MGADEQILAAIPAFLDWLTREAPVTLAGVAGELSGLDAASWRAWLAAAFADASTERSPRDTVALFVVEALLQPFAERSAEAGLTSGLPPKDSQSQQDEWRCPACGSHPVVGVLREEGHGARRTLVCARCHTEWPGRRVECVSCGEREFEALPVFTAEQFPHIRLDACERCRHYLKTVDLTRDGLAVPVVDDLASLALDLWARGEGYVRLRANLLRV
jgi:FdhE protein